MYSTNADDEVYVDATLSRLRCFGSYIKEEAEKHGFHGVLLDSVYHAEPTYTIQIRGPRYGVQRDLALKWLFANNISDEQLKALCQEDIEHLEKLERKEEKADVRECKPFKATK